MNVEEGIFRLSKGNEGREEFKSERRKNGY